MICKPLAEIYRRQRLWGEEVRERFNAPELNLARYIKDGTVTDIDNGK